MATYAEIMAKSRELYAAGDQEGAKRLAQIALQRKGEGETVTPNPDGTYGQPPEGYVLNPRTGQMTSRAELSNNMQPSNATSAAAGAHRGLSFGFGDEIQGALNAATPGPGTAGEKYAFGREWMRAMDDASRRDNPIATTAGEVGGAIGTALTPLGLGGQVSTRAAQVAPRAAQIAARTPILTRAAASSAQGAAMGGLYGWGVGEGGVSERAENARDSAILGGTVGAAVPFAGAGIQKYLNARAGRRAIREAAKAGRTTDELLGEGRALYRQVDDAGIVVKPAAAVRGYGETAVGLGEQGAARTYTGGVPHPMPSSAAMFQMAKGQAEDAVSKTGIPFRDIGIDSQIFRNTAASNAANPNDARIAKSGASRFEDWLIGLTPDDVVAGDVDVMRRALPQAREVWNRARKSEMIDDAVERGQNYLSGGASGIKNRFKTMLNNPKVASRFTEAEQAAMRRVIDGTPTEKLIDTFGGGLGQMATTATGGAVGSSAGPLGAIAGIGVGAATGQTARRASEALARRNAELARAAIASGKLPATLPRANPKTRAIIEQMLRANLSAAGAN